MSARPREHMFRVSFSLSRVSQLKMPGGTHLGLHYLLGGPSDISSAEAGVVTELALVILIMIVIPTSATIIREL